jgi:glycosyltransferase involved in cell wall biosynthesis
MRVLNVNASIGRHLGGGSERIYQLTRFLLRAGDDPHLLVVNNEWSRQAAVEASVEAHLTRMPTLNERFLVPGGKFLRLLELVRSCDVIHMMSHWSVLNALVYMAARRYRKPYVLCPAGAFTPIARSLRLKRVYSLLVGRRMIRHANAIIAIVPDEIPQIAQAGGDPKRVVVIPNAIIPEDYQARDDAGFRSRHGLGDAPLILFLGRMNLIKGPDLLIDAFCAARDVFPLHHVVYAGLEEGMWSIVRETAARSGIESRVHYIGVIQGREKSEALHAAEFLVIPSRQEAMSIVVLEAGAAATPVLITDRCGLDDIQGEGAGIIVTPTVSGLERGLREMARRRDELPQIGQRLRRYTIERYAWNSIVERYRSLFRDVISRRMQ